MLTPPLIESDLKPRFSRVLDAHKGIQYLANHSLGRMPDAAFDNSSRGITLWAEKMEEAWADDAWTGEILKFRSLIAGLVGLPGSNNIVMKTSAGQGLRAVLNSYPPLQKINVVSTRGEFDSIDFILKTYHQLGRANVSWAKMVPGVVPTIDSAEILSLIVPGTDLVVISAVMFATGQIVKGLEEIVAKAHSVGALVLIDSYHAVGTIPFDLASIGADFVIGGSYKYLRGAPGACFLGISDEVLASGRRTMDTGWYAKKYKFEFEKSDIAEVSPGADGWSESTPPVFTAFQSTPGIELVVELGVEAIRQHSLQTQAEMREILRQADYEVIEPENPLEWGAYSLVHAEDSHALVPELKEKGIITDARGQFVRFGPDFLTDLNEVSDLLH